MVSEIMHLGISSEYNASYIEEAKKRIRLVADKDIYLARIMIKVDNSELEYYYSIFGNDLLLYTSEIYEIIMLPPLCYLHIFGKNMAESRAQKNELNFGKLLEKAYASKQSLKVPILVQPYLPSVHHAAQTIEKRLRRVANQSLEFEAFVAATVEFLSLVPKNGNIDRVDNPIVDVLFTTKYKFSDLFDDWLAGRFSILQPVWIEKA